MQGFYNKAFKAYHVEIDPSNPVYDICEYIANHSMHKEEDKKNSRKRKDGTEDTIITTVQLILLSNASAPRFTMPPIKIQGDDKNINSFIWDINQLYTNINHLDFSKIAIYNLGDGNDVFRRSIDDFIF